MSVVRLPHRGLWQPVVGNLLTLASSLTTVGSLKLLLWWKSHTLLKFVSLMRVKTIGTGTFWLFLCPPAAVVKHASICDWNDDSDLSIHCFQLSASGVCGCGGCLMWIILNLWKNVCCFHSCWLQRLISSYAGVQDFDTWQQLCQSTEGISSASSITVSCLVYLFI